MNSINLSEQTNNCPLCGRHFRLAQRVPVALDFLSRSTIPVVSDFAYRLCPCGLYFAERYMSDEDVRTFYADGTYRLHSSGATGISDDLIKSETEHAAMIAPMIYERVQECRSILDIGCSSGVLLAELQEHYNCPVAGVEWNTILLDYCLNTRDIPCYADLGELGATYDLIILSHVLEHTLKPMELLRQVYDSLDGRLFVQVPVMMAGLPHPLVFSEAAAWYMIEQAGYKILGARADKHFTIWAGKAE